jgi:uncharacterized protein YbgA (DUF1722 family)/uncharacterized protein YbbK (DUF523 family)
MVGGDAGTLEIYEGNRESGITIGVSSCLLGQKVRYDGGHKQDHFITDILGRFFRFLPVCPEVECGMSIPRESMRLEGDPASPRLITNKSRIDKTEQMVSFSDRRARELAAEDLCGFIFKKNSPSSGLFRVKVYREGGMPEKSGSGLFAAAMVRHFPLLPMEEEGRLTDPDIRENFIERVFAYARWKKFLRSGGMKELVDFHTRHKLQIMAHSPAIYRELGTLVAHGKEVAWQELVQRYEVLFMKALTLHATVSKNCNVLQHIMGYFKKELSPAEKGELLEVIEQYRQHLVPLIVPLTLLKHYVAKYDQEYLQQQYYLSPHPAELMLRNHV